MGRKNRRKKSSYSRKMKVDPKRLIIKKTYSAFPGTDGGGTGLAGCAGYDEHNEYTGHTGTDDIPQQESGRIPQRGDIWFVDLGFHPGTSVQDGCRPVVILSNDMANFHSETLTVVPMTTRLKKAHLPTHVILAGECPSMETSMVLGEQLTTVGKPALRSYVGSLSPDKTREVERSVEAHLGLASNRD